MSKHMDSHPILRLIKKERQKQNELVDRDWSTYASLKPIIGYKQLALNVAKGRERALWEAYSSMELHGYSPFYKFFVALKWNLYYSWWHTPIQTTRQWVRKRKGDR
mgnify:CR=1 FL=1